MDCIFCKIANGEMPSTKFYEDDEILAFQDIEPETPVHILIIPKKHVMSSAAEITAENSAIIARIYEVAAQIAREQNLTDGFRIVNNCGPHARQSVQHLHFHLLGGRQMNAMG